MVIPGQKKPNRVELWYNGMKGTEYFFFFFCVVLTEEYNFMVNDEELIGTTEYLTLYARCRINRCHYDQVPLYQSNQNYRALSWIEGELNGLLGLTFLHIYYKSSTLNRQRNVEIESIWKCLFMNFTCGVNWILHSVLEGRRLFLYSSLTRFGMIDTST
jgi:hypothetical protein